MSVQETEIILSPSSPSDNEEDYDSLPESLVIHPPYVTLLESRFGISQSIALLMFEQGLVGDDILKFITEAELIELNWPLAARIRRRRWLAEGSASGPTSTMTSSLTDPKSGGGEGKRSLSAPKDLPTFEHEGGKWSARTFIEEFELICDVNDYPIAKRPLLLVSRLTGLARAWGKMNIKLSDDWTQAKRRFINHFLRSDESHFLRDKLLSIRQRTDESVRAFATRMQEIVLQLGDDIDHENILFLFKRGLLPSLSQYYLTAISVNPPRTFEAAVLQAIKLEPSNFSRPSAVKFEAHDESPRTTSPMIKGSPRRALPNPRAGPSQPRPTPSTSYPVCYSCGKKGHLAPQCRQAKKPDVIEIDLLDEDHSVTSLDNSKAFQNEFSNKASGNCFDEENVGMAQKKAQKDIECLVTDARMPVGDSRPKKTPRNDRIVSGAVTDGGIQIPILLQGRREFALLDTGASKSAINLDLQTELGTDIVKRDGTIISATGNSLRIGVSLVELQIGTICIKHEFELLPLPSQRVIIGRDLIAKIGISIKGIPYRWPDDPRQSSMMDADDTSIMKEAMEGWVPLTESIRQEILTAIKPEVFANSQTGWFCSHPSAKIPIDTGSHPPVYRRPYDVPYALKPMVTAKIQELYQRGIIRHSRRACRWNMPLLVAPKKDPSGRKTGIRVCLDTRLLNPLIPEDTFKVPLIRDIFTKVAGFQCASLIDLKEGYHQFLLLMEDQEKTTFEWEGEKFCYVGGPFGLRNIPGLFQRVMTEILEEFSKFCIVYIDDILIWSVTPEEHIHHLKQVLRKLNSVNLTISSEKSHIGFRQIVLLGHVYDGSTIRPEPSKITAFAKIPIPSTGKQIESLLGSANYLRDFIPNYSTICAPLEKLRKLRKLDSHWNEECAKSFETLKKVLSQAPVLSSPDFNHPFLVGTDASKTGVGAVLYQEIEGARKFIGFASAALTAGQRNYSTTRREMLAIIFALKKFRPYLYGTKFTLFTDHRALTYLLSQHHSNAMLAFWAETVLDFDMTICHRPGIAMILEDSLSRLYAPLSSQPPPSVNFPVILTSVIKDSPGDLMKEFIDQRLDKMMIDDPKVRQEMIQQTHGLGHFGAQGVFNELWSKGFYWPTMLKDIRSVINQCSACRRFSISHEGYHPLQPLVGDRPMRRVSADTLGPIQTSEDGHNYILVAVDLFTRFIFLEPLISKSANDVSLGLLNIFARFGFPEELLSDNGSEFKNETMKGISRLIGTTQKFSLPYNPRVNGTAENAVKLTKSVLFKMAIGDLSQWNRLIPFVMTALNARISSRHNSSAFTLMFGRQPKPTPTATNISAPTVLTEDNAETWKEHIQQLIDEVHPAILESTYRTVDRMKRNHKKYRRIVTELPIGTKVMVKRTNRTSKAMPIYHGPFTVIQRSGNSYTLIDTTGALHPSKIPIQRLKRLQDDESADIPTFEVEKILLHRGAGSSREYLVKWKGFSDKENSWVKVHDFNETDAITDYHKGIS